MKKMQFFCSIAKNTSDLLGKMPVFSGRGLFSSGFCRAGKRIVSRGGAETRRKKGGMNFFCQKTLLP
jgi:hypothetical protein